MTTIMRIGGNSGQKILHKYAAGVYFYVDVENFKYVAIYMFGYRYSGTNINDKAWIKVNGIDHNNQNVDVMHRNLVARANSYAHYDISNLKTLMVDGRGNNLIKGNIVIILFEKKLVERDVIG